MTTVAPESTAPGGALVPQLASRPPAPIAQTASAAVAAQAKSLVEAAYLVALQHPRDVQLARLKILAACKRPTFARAARYSKPVGGTKPAVGPSIRFAEEATRAMGNIRAEMPVIYEDQEQRMIRVVATDLEANVSYHRDVAVQKTVERRKAREGQLVIAQRTTSTGNLVYLIGATDDELLNKQNALCSKALREVLLRLIPSDVVEDAMVQVETTLDDEDAKDPSAARKRMLEAFFALGVKPEDLRDYLGHEVDQATREEMRELAAVWQAIKDNETSWGAVIEARETTGASGTETAHAKGTAGLKDKLKAKGENGAPKAEPEASAPPAQSDADRQLDLKAAAEEG